LAARRKAEAHVIATARTNEGLVGIVEVEISRELVGRRFAVEPAVTTFLLLGQKADGHRDHSQKL
jgi:hypothetical protein